MAKFPKIIGALTKIDGRDPGAVKQFGRAIRDAGFIPGGKRGVGAPNLDVSHVASLLIGTYSGDSPAKAAKQIVNYRRMVKKGTHPEVIVHEHEGFDNTKYKNSKIVAAINEAENFGEAIEWLVANGVEVVEELISFGTFPTEPKEGETLLHRLDRVSAHALNVEFNRTYVVMTIIDAWNNVHIAARFDTPDDLYHEFDQQFRSDRNVKINFTHRTFLALAEAMKED